MLNKMLSVNAILHLYTATVSILGVLPTVHRLTFKLFKPLTEH